MSNQEYKLKRDARIRLNHLEMPEFGVIERDVWPPDTNHERVVQRINAINEAIAKDSECLYKSDLDGKKYPVKIVDVSLFPNYEMIVIEFVGETIDFYGLGDHPVSQKRKSYCKTIHYMDHQLILPPVTSKG